MSALWIAHVTVTDADAYGRYAALAGPVIAAHGGVFLARATRMCNSRATRAPATWWRAFPTSRMRSPVTTRPGIRRRLNMPKVQPRRDLVIVEGKPCLKAGDELLSFPC